MTWKEFNDLVGSLLTVDSGRLGLEEFVPKMIRQAAIEISNLVTRYSAGHEDTYNPADFTTSGSASVGDMPTDNAELREAVILRTSVETGIITEHPCTDYPWEQRGNLIGGQASIIDNNGLIAMSPKGDEFIVFPKIQNGELIGDATYNYRLRLNYDGIKLDYADTDTVPFDEPMAIVVVDYVKAEIARHVDHDLAMAASFSGSYAQRRQNLFLNRRARLTT